MAEPIWEKIDPLSVPMWNGKLEDGTFSLAEGDELLGTYQGVEGNIGPNKANVYTFKDKEGSLISVWGSTLLDTRFKNLEKGELVKVVYLGLVKSEKTGRSYHSYDVFHAKKDNIPVIGG